MKLLEPAASWVTVGKLLEIGRRWAADPRHFQIAALASLIGYGAVAFDFGLRFDNALAILGAGLLTQLLLARRRGERFDPRSPLITCLSLILLLRADHAAIAGLAAVLAIASKFWLRAQDRHFFNPANFGIVAVLLLTPGAWVSAGQWGNTALLSFAVLCLGTVVVTRAVRADVTSAFLFFYTGMLAARALWLGDPWVVPAHHLQSGALLIFAFFMISDPKTTPVTRVGRVLFAALVAAGAMYVHFVLYRPNGLIWSLICCAPLVPLIDSLVPGNAYQWRPRAPQPAILTRSEA